MKKFASEAEMQEKFNEFLHDTLLQEEDIYLENELKGLVGIPDVVVYEKRNIYVNYVLSIELKLKNWQRALVQAYKYSSFSNMTFAIMDEATMAPALKNIIEFEHANVGLASFNIYKELKIYFVPEEKATFSKRLMYRFLEMMTNKSIEKKLYSNCSKLIYPTIRNIYENTEL